LRSAASITTDEIAAARIELVVSAQTPEASPDGNSVYAGKEWTFELTAENPSIPIGRSKAKKFLNGGISMPKDGGVSTSHAKIEFREGRLLYTDQGSSNGSWLNGAEVKEHADMELTSGDKLIVGNTELTVRITSDGSSKSEQ
jgi:pSer/pThr/pTyr-binding forkhead associated (FHA) protein